MEAEDENWRQGRVDQHSDEHGQHGDFRIALAANHAVHAEADELKDAPFYDDAQVISGKGQNVRAGAEPRRNQSSR